MSRAELGPSVRAEDVLANPGQQRGRARNGVACAVVGPEVQSAARSRPQPNDAVCCVRTRRPGRTGGVGSQRYRWTGPPGRSALLACALLAATAQAGEIIVTPAFEAAAWLSRGQPLELRLSHRPADEEGRLAVFVDRTDVTSVTVWRDTTLLYGPGALRVPPGEHELTVYLVGNEGTWTELGRFPFKVRTGAGFDTAEVMPAVDLTGKGQVDEGHAPADNAPNPATFHDGTLQAGLRTTHVRGDFAMRTSLSVVGATNQQETLRFAEEGEDAPRVDLSAYLVELEKGPVKLAVGHVAFGANRLLASGIAARGASLSWRLSPALSVDAAATSGSTIVGWSNLSGLTNSDHQLRWVTLGSEFLPTHPGTFRLELSYLDGSLQPITSFNQGAVTAAETSTGGAVRLLAADFGRRLQVEAGYARTTFRPASDPQLEEGLDVTPIAESTRDARFADVTIALLQGARLGQDSQVNLALALHHQRVEPLYRSVAASLGADIEQNSADLTASIGGVSVQASHQRSEDNLADIRTILKTMTRRSAANLAVPLRDLLGGSAWWPVLTAGWDRTHQYGASLPEGGSFQPENVPDQESTGRTVGVDWSGARLRAGYHWSDTSQDNRQPGSEQADSLTRTDAIALGATVSPRLELGVDGSLERQDNLETGRTDRTRRLGINATWRTTDWMTIGGSVAKTRTWDSQDQGESDGFDSDAQWSASFPLGWLGLKAARGSLFARYANRHQQTLDRVLNIDQDRRVWTVNTGLNVSLF